MLQRLEVKNFLALRDIGIDLEPFTVLVGANASGKTIILEALHRVCALRSGNARVLVEGGDITYKITNTEFVSPENIKTANAANEIVFTVVIDSVKTDISILFNALLNGTGWRIEIPEVGSEHFEKYMPRIQKYAKANFPKSLLIQANFSSLSKPSHSPLKIPFLERSGSGLATICAYLQQEMPDTFSRVQEYLASIIRGLKRFRIRRADGTKQNFVNGEPEKFREWRGIAEELIFDFDDAMGVPAKYVSEGTLLVLCILVAAARFEGEALILIDDLERGLHPKAVRDLIGALRKLQEINPKLQIVATSHSPYILSELKPQEVRVVARDPLAGTVVGRLTDHPDFAKWSEVMDVGEFWSHVGEDWLLKAKEYA